MSSDQLIPPQRASDEEAHPFGQSIMHIERVYKAPAPDAVWEVVDRLIAEGCCGAIWIGGERVGVAVRTWTYDITEYAWFWREAFTFAWAVNGLAEPRSCDRIRVAFAEDYKRHCPFCAAVEDDHCPVSGACPRDDGFEYGSGLNGGESRR